MTGAARIDQVGVVIPVRNEELLLPRCLTALAVAVAAVAESPSIDRPRVTVVIVLDRCTDASASVAADWPECTRIVSSAGAVGAARRAGTARALATILDSATGSPPSWHSPATVPGWCSEPWFPTPT
jgi:glycosyltransferase involved in cell wall biosynthesis